MNQDNNKPQNNKTPNKISHPALIIWFAIAVLFSFRFINLPVIPYINNYSKIDLLQDLKADNKAVTAVRKTAPRLADATGKDIAATTVDFFDSSLINDYADDTTANMQAFYNKLAALKTSKGKVRIAYFGDSYIEADYITGQLRSKLQQLYGGNGPGFIPMQSVVAGEYISLKFGSATSWTDYNYHNNTPKNALGLSGHVYYSTGNSSSQYAALKGNTFNQVYLYTGQTPAAANVTVEKDGVEETITVNNSDYINSTPLNNGAAVSKLSVHCTNTSLPVYGISMEDSTGVYIDNYGFRGNTGALTLQLQPQVLEGFQQHFKYDLIVLHYGLNVVSHNDTNYAWYVRSMAKLVEKVKANFPGVPVLMVSTSDVAYNEAGVYITDPVVPVLVATQQNIARTNKTAFFNLYYAMGGEGTIANWVQGDTTYAYKDYMHVNERGANKVAGIFLDKLLHSSKK